MRRFIGALVGMAFVLGTVTAARADEANRECANNQDVTVVVDFAGLGGGVNVRCAPQGADGIKTGFDALEHARISYEQSGGFLCRIAGRPESTDCSNRPGVGPYWAYYWAKRGGDWKYSNQGAGARKPPPGSVEGWTYADDNGQSSPPRYPVPAPVPEPSAAPSSTAHPSSPGTSPAAPGSTPPRARTTATTSAGTPTTGAAAPATVAAGDDAPVGPTTTTSLALGNVDLSIEQGGGGTSAGFIASLGGLAGLVAAAFVFLRLRGR